MPVSATFSEDAHSQSWDALEDLYRSSRDDVFAYLRTLMGERAVAEDLTELTFERAYTHWSKFDPARGEPRQWLFGIARNAALDEMRRRRRTEPLLADLKMPDEQADHATALADQDERIGRAQAIQSALTRLPQRDRELIGLKFYAELSNGQIAALLGVSETNAGTLLYRAIQKLRGVFDV